MTYEHTLASESITVLEALLTGLVLGVYYDVFRIIRRIVHCRYATIVAQDLFFWTTSGIFTFFVCIRLNNGLFRILFAAAALAGFSLYLLTLGSVVMTVTDFILKIIHIIGDGIHKNMIVPAGEMLKKARKARKTEKNKEIDNKI